MRAIEKWHAFVTDRDIGTLRHLLDPDVVFESPVVHTPQVGRDITARYLVAAMQVLGNEGFRYVGEWRNETGAVLEFATEIDGISVNGVDIIRCSGDGERIVHFKVMVRPLKAIEVVRRQMAALLAAAGGQAPPGA